MDLEGANRAIRSAWIAAVVVGVLTTVISVMVYLGYEVKGFTPWNLVDALLVFAMAYGIYKKSRVCAVIMLVYWVASKILVFVDTREFGAHLPIINWPGRRKRRRASRGRSSFKGPLQSF